MTPEQIKKYKTPMEQCQGCKWHKNENGGYCDKPSGDFVRYGPTDVRFCGYFRELSVTSD